MQKTGHPDSSGASVPLVWLLTGHKAGDNNQVLALAEALGWPFEIKKFVYRKYNLFTNLMPRGALAGVVKKESSRLEPAWPDLVISAGRRNEPVARWIRHKVGPGVRLVHIGRPWAPLETFDLIVTTAQYQLPDRPNVVRNLLPLHRVTDERLESAARKWEPRFAHLPRPWTAVLLGGDSGPFVFTPEKGARLGRQVNQLVQDTGGSVLISDSARTPEAAFQGFQAELDFPIYVYRWRMPGAENPYFGYLGLADSIVVTGESMSMLTEACATHKPLMIFDLSDRVCSGEAGRRGDSGSNVDCQPWWRRRHNLRFKPLSHRLAMRFGPKRMRRDIGVIQQQLVATGRAVWLGQAPVDERYRLPIDDLERAVVQVRGLFYT